MSVCAMDTLALNVALPGKPARALRRLLLIDDEEDIREIGTMSLEAGDSGFEVLTASDGATGIAMARDAQPDVILLDMMMPGIDGTATFARLKSDDSTRGIPVIFLTASARPLERRRIHELGPLGLIAKPFNPMTLSAEVLTMLGE